MIIQVKVKLNARVSALDEAADGSFVAHIKSPPIDGRANAELIELVARRFQCRKAAVSIKAGASSRTKWVEIETP
jgi:uncharacterized protein (TIGR00251 family)